MLHLTFTTWKTTFELFHIEVYSRNQTYKKISFSREFSEVNFYRISRKSSQPESLEHFHRGGCSPVICISRIANQKTGLLNICIIGECQRIFFNNFFFQKVENRINAGDQFAGSPIHPLTSTSLFARTDWVKLSNNNGCNRLLVKTQRQKPFNFIAAEKNLWKLFIKNVCCDQLWFRKWNPN